MYEVKRRNAATGIARTGLPLRGAALGLVVDLELAPVVVPDPEAVAGKRVELMTAEVTGTVTFVVPCWTVKYMPAMGWLRLVSDTYPVRLAVVTAVFDLLRAAGGENVIGWAYSRIT